MPPEIAFPANLATAPVTWLSKEEPQATDIIVAIRMELSRNLDDTPFPARAKPSSRHSLARKIKRYLHDNPPFPGCFLDGAEINDRLSSILQERWLIDQDFNNAGPGRALWLGEDGAAAILVNHEEHLRIRACGCGLEYSRPLTIVKAAATDWQTQLPVAFNSELGYLSSNPGKLGAGLQIAVIAHLPGLVFNGQIEPILRAAHQLDMQTKTAFGQGNAAVGDFFEFSWQAPRNKHLENALAKFLALVRQIRQSEMAARHQMAKTAGETIRNQAGRAYGILRHATMLNETEMIELLGDVRLGCWQKLFSCLKSADLTESLVNMRNGHLAEKEKIADNSDSWEDSLARQRASHLKTILREAELKYRSSSQNNIDNINNRS